MNHLEGLTHNDRKGEIDKTVNKELEIGERAKLECGCKITRVEDKREDRTIAGYIGFCKSKQKDMELKRLTATPKVKIPTVEDPTEYRKIRRGELENLEDYFGDKTIIAVSKSVRKLADGSHIPEKVVVKRSRKNCTDNTSIEYTVFIEGMGYDWSYHRVGKTPV